MIEELSPEQQDTINNWQNSFLSKALAAHTREYFYQHPILKNIPEDVKQELIADFYKKIFDLTNSEEPLLTLRGYIASYVHSYAIFQVLCLSPKEKTSAFYHNNPYISGNLRKHIKSIAIHNKEISELNLKNELLTDEDLLAFCQTKAAISMFYMNGMNIVRCELKDMVKENDWLRPFIESMLIWEEDTCRKNIGLSSLLENSLDADKHYSFLEYVSNGSQDPYTAWQAGDENIDEILFEQGSH